MAEMRQELEAVLAALRKTGDVEASAIVRRDGLIIASDMPAFVDSHTLAAMAASLVGAGEGSAGELGLGRFGQAVVESAEGKLVAVGAGENSLLVCLVGKDANLGMALVNMEKSGKKIADLLG